jgi:hypothetical protein
LAKKKAARKRATTKREGKPLAELMRATSTRYRAVPEAVLPPEWGPEEQAPSLQRSDSYWKVGA